MTTLADVLLEPSRRNALVRDLVALAHRHVAQRSGLRGMTLRAGLAGFERLHPEAVAQAIERLLPELAVALDDGRPLTTATLMSVADARVARSRNPAVRSLYAKFRGIAKREAEEIVPGLAGVIAKHL
jgi:hypothetical protein